MDHQTKDEQICIEHFYQCRICKQWLSSDNFLEGMQVEPTSIGIKDGDIYRNVYHFTHDIPECGAQIELPVSKFEPFINEPISPEIIGGQSQCQMLCTNDADVRECSQDCYYAPFRRLFTLMQHNFETKQAD